jgi:hypothetical protein
MVDSKVDSKGLLWGMMMENQLVEQTGLQWVNPWVES